MRISTPIIVASLGLLLGLATAQAGTDAGKGTEKSKPAAVERPTDKQAPSKEKQTPGKLLSPPAESPAAPAPAPAEEAPPEREASTAPPPGMIAPFAQWNPVENGPTFEASADLARCPKSTLCTPVLAKVKGVSAGSGDHETYDITISFGTGEAGRTLSLPRESISGAISFTTVEVDAKNSLREIALSYYTGGAHCCSYLGIFSETPAGIALADFGERDGDAYGGSFPKSFESRPIFEFSDDRFKYLFGPYSDSAAPASLLKVEGGEIVDVTTDPANAAIHRHWMEVFKPGCGDGINGHCAGYVASAWRVGAQKEAEAYMLMHHTSRRTNPDIWLPEYCRTKITGSAECPITDKITFADFPDALAYVLHEWGYSH